MNHLPSDIALSGGTLTHVFTFLPLRETVRSCSTVSRTWSQALQGLENFTRENTDIQQALCPYIEVIPYAKSHGFPVYSEVMLVKLFQRYITSTQPFSRLSIFLPCEDTIIAVQQAGTTFEEQSSHKQLLAQLPSFEETAQGTPAARSHSVFFLDTSELFSVCVQVNDPSSDKTLRIKRIFDQLISYTHQREETPYSIYGPDRTLEVVSTRSLQEQPKPWNYFLVLTIFSIIVMTCHIFPSIGAAFSTALNF